MIHKSPLKPSELQSAWDLLCDPQSSPFGDERTTCLDLLNQAMKNGHKDTLNNHLAMMTNECLADLLWLASQNPTLMSYCCQEPSTQAIWENYLNNILQCNSVEATVDTQAHQPLFYTVMGQFIAFQSNDHVHQEGLIEGLLNDEGVALLRLSLHYQSLYGAEFMLYHLVSLGSPFQVAEQIELFHPLVEAHGAPGARACALVYWLYTTKFTKGNLSQDESICIDIALQKTLEYAKVAELLTPYCQADWANSAFLSQNYWPFNGQNSDAVLTVLDRSRSEQISDKMLQIAQQDALRTTQQWTSTHLEDTQGDVEESSWQGPSM